MKNLTVRIYNMEKCSKLNCFCYVCGHYITQNVKKSLEEKKNIGKNFFTTEFRTAYTLYYNQPDLTEEDFTPNSACTTCYRGLINWLHGKKSKLQYGTPVVWVKQNTHDTAECYACRNFDEGKKNKKVKVYQTTLTGSLPLPLLADVDPPRPPSPDTLSTITATTATNDNDATYVPSDLEDDERELISKLEMDYIVAKMLLSQENAEFLTTFLKKKKMTEVNATDYRKRQADYQRFFTLDESKTMAYCNDIEGLMFKMGLECNVEDWRLFTDGSQSSLKAVLLHKSNKKPSVPLFFSTTMKENHDSMVQLFEMIKYKTYKWKVCCDLKLANILCGVKRGFPKYFCFKCNWNTRQKVDHYTYDGWTGENPEMTDKVIENVDKILLPPLHIKLGIVQKFIETTLKAKDDDGKMKNVAVFDCLKTIFKKLSEAKILGGTGQFSNIHH